MPRIAFLSHHIRPVDGQVGDVVTFITLFARMLKENGDDVTFVTRKELHAFASDPRWCEDLRAGGIELVEVHGEPAAPSGWPDIWPMRLSEQLAPILRNFDIVYFADCADLAIHTIRMKRFTTKPTPVCVTALHRPSNWILAADRRYPVIPGHLSLEFSERYSARHSDFVIATSRQVLDRVKKEGWQFTREPEVLGIPYRPERIQRPGQAARDLKRLTYFGRLDGHKVLGLFVSALRELSKESPEELRRLDEVVLMGHDHPSGMPSESLRELNQTGLRMTLLANVDSFQACEYLNKHMFPIPLS
jgi:glycosyltransferase involved in cell wall biosynthesis